MRAVAVAAFRAEPELVHVPKPEPGEGEILVKVEFAALNPAPVSARAGARPVALRAGGRPLAARADGRPVDVRAAWAAEIGG